MMLNVAYECITLHNYLSVFFGKVEQKSHQHELSFSVWKLNAALGELGGSRN